MCTISSNIMMFELIVFIGRCLNVICVLYLIYCCKYEIVKLQVSANFSVGESTMEYAENNYLVESENVNAEHNLNVVENETVGRDGAIVPEVGLKFKDVDEVFDFYKS